MSLHMSEALRAYRVKITGIVQGVGFRPFVYSLALKHKLTGWVINTSAGVDIEVEGSQGVLGEFLDSLQSEAPPLARINTFEYVEKKLEGYDDFEIRQSKSIAGEYQPISPDMSVCDDCLRELNDPQDRRFRYPFINCTNCGPRFTIIQDIPYDRPFTTMSSFEMCAQCKQEYLDPLDRRFHAQPIACPNCGPKITFTNLLDSEESSVLHAEAALQEALSRIHVGDILAVKGLGGFHLACDATNDEAVKTLRERKGRVDKPFALMMADMDMVKRHCQVSEDEQRLLTSKERPIVLLYRREASKPSVSSHVAPGQHTLGVMLPYTPLHYLLFPEGACVPLVMTSGNFAEEPIVTRNEEALVLLETLADGFLYHDREIHTRTDDSVVRLVDGEELPLRRSRGYAPFPVLLQDSLPATLAVGGELKNTFCLTKEKFAFMSHHIGDMENLETLCSFEDGVSHYEALFRVTPQVLAHDLHPDYRTTRYALNRSNQEGIPAVAVQHHHAHIAACLAENRYPEHEPVIGVAFDGTGYGDDGSIWGGEFLVANYSRYERVAHLMNMPLPGGDASIRKPARLAYAYLLASEMAIRPTLPLMKHLSKTECKILKTQVESGVNAPSTSSMGRLFDVVAALIGLRHEVNYEGQAAIELEAIADEHEQGAYRFDLQQFAHADDYPLDGSRDDQHIHRMMDRQDKSLDGKRPGALVVDIRPVLQMVVEDFLSGVHQGIIATRFHNAVADMIQDVCMWIRTHQQHETVAFSGGVFQNVKLLSKVNKRLRASDFKVLQHRIVPPNDAGIALGQAMVANKKLDEVER